MAPSRSIDAIAALAFAGLVGSPSRKSEAKTTMHKHYGMPLESDGHAHTNTDDEAPETVYTEETYTAAPARQHTHPRAGMGAVITREEEHRAEAALRGGKDPRVERAPEVLELLRDAYVDLRIQASTTGSDSRKERADRILALLTELDADPFRL